MIKIQKGINDLETKCPQVAAEWNYRKNGSLLPSEIGAGTHLKVWWKCIKGHEWEARVDSRTGGGNSCPYCSGQKVLQGFNDLATFNLDAANEWHPTKNATLLPSMVVPGSNKKVWWMCEEGHEWETSPNKRTQGTGCPKCWKKRSGKVTRKIVEQYTSDGEFVEEYESLTVAAKKKGISASGISNCCNGKAKSAAGYVWKWKN